jgi:hypothetical protein
MIMEISGKTQRKASPTGAAIDIAIRLGVLAVLAACCFQILRPFVSPIVWEIIGVSIIQALRAGLRFAVAGIPAAGLWALLCLILAIIQSGYPVRGV